MSCDILLIQPSHNQGKNVKYFGKEIPLNLAYLSSYLEENGFSTEIIDLELYDNPHSFFRKSLKRFNPKIVGFTAFTMDIINSYSLSKIVKELDPNIDTVVGGIHASALPVETLRKFESFDYLVYGEGFITFVELAKTLISSNQKSNLRKIDGLVYRKNGVVIKNKPRKLIENIDELPFPAREKLDNLKYKPHLQRCKRLPSTGIISSIGCSFRCNYCSVSIVNKKVRFRSPHNVLEEMKFCMDNFGISDFRFFDDCMTLDNKRLAKLCKLIIKSKLDLVWNCQSRAGTVNLELLKLMKKAHCHQISYGLETGTEKVLKILNKGITLQQARKSISMAKKVGLETTASFMIGAPNETIADIKQTIKFAKEISPDLAMFYILKAYPGTQVYNDSIKKGVLKDVSWDEYLMHNPSVLKESLNDKELTEILNYAYTSFYFRPNYMLQRTKKFIKNPLSESRLVLNGFKILFSYFRR